MPDDQCFSLHRQCLLHLSEQPRFVDAAVFIFRRGREESGGASITVALD